MRLDFRGLTVLLLSFLWIQTTCGGRFSYEVPQNKTVAASLFLVGEDSGGVVQTLLENLGLWGAFDWRALYHFNNEATTYKRLNSENLEKSIYDMANFTSIEETYYWRCVCYALPSALTKYKHYTGSVGETIVVLVQLDKESSDDCLSNGTNCNDALKTVSEGGAFIRSSAPGITPFEISRMITNSTGVRPKTAAFLPEVPIAEEDWKQLWKARDDLRFKLEENGISLPREEPTCHAMVPERTNCTLGKSQVCSPLMPILYRKTGNPVDSCPKEPYCRDCFRSNSGIETTSSVETSGTTSSETTEAHTHTIQDFTPLDDLQATQTTNGRNVGVQSPMPKSGAKNSPEEDPEESGLPMWVIIVIAVTVIVISLAAIVAAFILLKSWMNRETSRSPAIETNPVSPSSYEVKPILPTGHHTRNPVFPFYENNQTMKSCTSKNDTVDSPTSNAGGTETGTTGSLYSGAYTVPVNTTSMEETSKPEAPDETHKKSQPGGNQYSEVLL